MDISSTTTTKNHQNSSESYDEFHLYSDSQQDALHSSSDDSNETPSKELSNNNHSKLKSKKSKDAMQILISTPFSNRLFTLRLVSVSFFNETIFSNTTRLDSPIEHIDINTNINPNNSTNPSSHVFLSSLSPSMQYELQRSLPVHITDDGHIFLGCSTGTLCHGQLHTLPNIHHTETPHRTLHTNDTNNINNTNNSQNVTETEKKENVEFRKTTLETHTIHTPRATRRKSILLNENNNNNNNNEIIHRSSSTASHSSSLWDGQMDYSDAFSSDSNNKITHTINNNIITNKNNNNSNNNNPQNPSNPSPTHSFPHFIPPFVPHSSLLSADPRYSSALLFLPSPPLSFSSAFSKELRNKSRYENNINGPINTNSNKNMGNTIPNNNNNHPRVISSQLSRHPALSHLLLTNTYTDGSIRTLPWPSFIHHPHKTILNNNNNTKTNNNKSSLVPYPFRVLNTRSLFRSPPFNPTTLITSFFAQLCSPNKHTSPVNTGDNSVNNSNMNNNNTNNNNAKSNIPYLFHSIQRSNSTPDNNNTNKSNKNTANKPINYPPLTNKNNNKVIKL